MLSEDILYLPVTGLARMVRQKQLSPVKLTESYLERSRKLGARLNAYANLTPELAMKQAHAAEKEIAAGKYRGPLHGIPYAAKDLLAVKGYPTTWGARPYAQQTFDYDAGVVHRLEAAGAILIGKAAMIELAGGLGYRFPSASATGPAKNPWNEDHWTCGSSSGSAAVVGAGLAGFALGTETWGSIICPSGMVGLSGLRPTFGRVSRHGAMALAYSMDKIGPMARSADDCDLILQAIAGHDARDAGSLPEAVARYTGAPEPKKPLRIGWMTNQWKEKEISAEVGKAMAEARQVLERHPLIAMGEIKLPEGPWEAAAGTIVSVEAVAAYRDLIESGRAAELSDPVGRIGGYMGEAISASDFITAQRVREVVQGKMEDLFTSTDVLATVTLPVTAPRIDANLDDALSFADPIGGIGNICGLPAISVPCGLGAGNLPIGLQFIGRPQDDARVVQAARLFQGQTGWHKRHPQIA
ncbi:MAG TPA: amidase [Candidatus Saccharimonadales bacterium]|jgi:aspartyl-tRNA(Asn)/glutamyl-tRNA(Gln) amidotransferase subunit A|nr:amidase [Candidatus Saccharimonadales bacterium]